MTKTIDLSVADLFTLRMLLESLQPCPGCGKMHPIVLEGAPTICAERLVGHGFAEREHAEEVDLMGYTLTQVGLSFLSTRGMDKPISADEAPFADKAYSEMSDDVQGVGDDLIRVYEFFAELASGESEELFAVAYDHPNFKKVLELAMEFEKQIEAEMLRRNLPALKLHEAAPVASASPRVLGSNERLEDIPTPLTRH